MTKMLKGLLGRTFTTSTTDEFLSGRNIFLTQPIDRLNDTNLIGQLSALDPESKPGASDQIVADLSHAGKGGLDFVTCGLDFRNAKSVSGHGHEHGLDRGHDGGTTQAPPPTLFDEGTLNVAVGGAVSGVIDIDGDVDTITVNLVAGQTYLFSLRGTGATPLSDAWLEVYNPSNVLINHDDDGGNGVNSLMTITAAVSGTYTILAQGFPDMPPDPPRDITGGWTVDVRLQGADEAGSTFGTAASLGLGTTFGFRNSGTDTDMYQITLTEGQLYTFELDGGADYESDWQALPPGELDTILRLYDSNGVLVASNDDVAFPDDISSAIGYLVEQGGTYYLEVGVSPAAANPQSQTGGYVIDVNTIDLADLDPLDSIDWVSADNVDFVDVLGTPTAYVYFAPAGVNFGETGDDGVSPADSFGWTAQQQAQVMVALQQYEHILGVNYEITTDVNQATFRIFTTTSTQFGAYFYPQDPAYGTQQGIGAFNVDSGGFTTPASLDQGGYSFAVILHEFGHAHGLAHPHDNGGGSEVMLGVTAATGSYGVFNLNQGVYTVMSYNDAWDFHPDGPSPFTLATVGFGWSGSLSAFDIAALQLRYGVHDYNVGNNVYTLDDSDAIGTFYECIWDTGGTDAINYVGSRNAVIDLTAATLDYSATGGGVLSYVRNVHGGFTIANGVVIENATSGGGNDMLIGNSAANVLTAGGGTDILIGREGDDTLDGGGGTDTVVFGGNIADYTITAILGGYTVEDNNAADGDDGFDTVIGGEYLQFADDVFTVDPDPLNNDIPSLGGLINALTFNENVVNAAAQLIDGSVDFQDDDINGGTLTVSGLLAEDRVAIRNEGTGIGQIGVDGNEISYNGIVVGTFTGGTGNTLTVTFTVAVTAPAVDALIQNLTYANVSEDPTLNRTLTVALVDDQGAAMTIVPTFVHSFVELTGAADPLANPPLPTFGANPNPGFVDVDGDGDLDMVMGDVAGTFRYFQKSGAIYTEQTGAANPFNTFDVGAYSNPEAIDLDGDGDSDLVTGATAGTIFAWRNNGAGSWTQLVGAGVNPFNGVDIGSASDVAAVDINGDGRLDLVVGNQAGTIDVFIHNADHTFTQQIGAANPFNGIDLGSYSSPAGIDVDGDGDTDVLFGNNAGTIRTFLNNGSGAFTEATGTANPFNGIDVGSFSNLSAADLNGDGDRDLVVGDLSGGDTRVWDHVITPVSSPNITITVNAQNDAPSGTDHQVTFYQGGNHVFTVAEFGYSDIDGDNFASVVINSLPVQGTLRLNGVAVTVGQVITVANINSGLLVFTGDANESGPHYGDFLFSVRDDGGTANGGLNTDPTPNLMAIEVLPTNSPPRLTDVVETLTYDENVVNVTPQILDLDVTFNDPDNNFNGGTLTVTGLAADDLLSVNNEGTGAGQIGLSGANVTYEGVIIGTLAGGNGATLTVTFNGAADSEAVEALIENLTYANTSDHPTADRTLTINVTDAAGADLAFQTVFGLFDDDPLLGLSNGGTYSTPTFLDVDGDGDVDMISGGNTGAIFYYRNNAGTFAEVPGSQNPFNGIDLGAFTATTAINVDLDSDLDLVVGLQDGTLATFRNNGNGTFTQLTGAANPFNGVDVGSYSAPAGGDIDGDGDMDLIVGELNGTILTFRNNGNGTFTQLAGNANPFAGIDLDYLANPSLFDLDGDGDLDAIIGNYYGGIYAFNNGGVFTVADPSQNPFQGLFVGNGPAFGFGDLDGDGDLDAAVGSQYGDFIGLENLTPTSVSIDIHVNAQVDRVQLYNAANVLVDTFNDIQDAIDAASNGFRIVAPAGTYAENLVVNKDVTIEGANAGVPGDGTRGAETVITGGVTITVDGVTINGVEITGSVGSAGITVNAGSDAFTLVNSVLSGMTDAYGILTGQISDLNVTDNLLVGYGIGMYVSGGASTGVIHSNLFQGGGVEAVFVTTNQGLYNGVILETSHVTVSDNTFDNMYYSSIVITPFGPDLVDLQTFITGNDYPGTLAERVIFVYPTNDTHNVLGTDANEGFDAETAQAPGPGGYGYTMASTSFDGRGGNDYAWGGELSDTFIGGAGSDQLFGKGGDDILTGGTDNDLLDGDAGVDTATFADASVTFADTVIGWLVTSATEGNDFLQEVEIAVEGSGQRNLLVGSTAFATIQAAANNAEDGDIIRLASGSYSGTVNYSDEDLVVIAQNGAVQNVTYVGTAGISVYGDGGLDQIRTGNGDDLIDGGLGNDVVAGGGGNDTYYVNQGGDFVTELGGEGYDRVFASADYTLFAGQEIEVLSARDSAATTALALGGNDLSNYIIGNAGDNILYGKGGFDVLEGLGGNDSYLVDDAGEYIVELEGGGNDRVYASVDYTLNDDASVETLSTDYNAGTSNIALGGNNLNNTIIGNEGNNTLYGKAGNDVLIGNGGADTFFFTTYGDDDVDSILDFVHGTDKIAFYSGVFTGLAGGVTAANFVNGTAAADANDRVIYDAATGSLYYDADGTGAGAQVLVATLDNNPVLTVSDFQVI